MKITSAIMTNTAITAKEKYLFSNFRCIKTRKTNVDLTTAIKRAIATVRVPSEICVTETEIRVNVINPARTRRNVLYGII
jgi:hypothetical protein